MTGEEGVTSWERETQREEMTERECRVNGRGVTGKEREKDDGERGG